MCRLSVLLSLTLVAPIGLGCPIYDPAFNWTGSNPSDAGIRPNVWSYRERPLGEISFSLLPLYGEGLGPAGHPLEGEPVDFWWNGLEGPFTRSVLHNPVDSFGWTGGGMPPPPGYERTLSLYPGLGAVSVRFTSPVDQGYWANGAFVAARGIPNPVIVGFLINESFTLLELSPGYDPFAAFTFEKVGFSLRAGESIDFYVSSTGSPSATETWFSVLLVPIPEPSAILMLGGGLALLAILRRNRLQPPPSA